MFQNQYIIPVNCHCVPQTVFCSISWPESNLFSILYICMWPESDFIFNVHSNHHDTGKSTSCNIYCFCICGTMIVIWILDMEHIGHCIWHSTTQCCKQWMGAHNLFIWHVLCKKIGHISWLLTSLWNRELLWVVSSSPILDLLPMTVIIFVSP